VHGLEVVLEAARSLADEPVRFVLVGDGSEKPALLQRASEMDLDNVAFLDPVPPEEIAAMLRCATVSLATVRAGDSYSTIRSAKALPAMSSACPVVYSADDEGSRLVGSIGAGIVTAAGDPEQLADAIRTIIADPALGERLGSAGRAWIEDHASWHHLVGVWLDRLDEIERSAGASVATGEGSRR
jgi:colanic acid biosynthesis glycosyl transferase WcaI